MNDLNLIESLVHNIVEKIDFSLVKNLSLINNAGVLSPMMPADRCASTEILQNFQVNTIAPIILTAQFIKQTENMNCKRTVVNISSGAGKKPYYGWSAYCSSKAAIDMYTKVLGLEQANRENPVKIFSFAPGVVDTEMQEKIRKTKVEDFDSVERFKAFKQDCKLLKPEFVAKKLIDLMNRSDLIQGGIYDINEFF